MEVHVGGRTRALDNLSLTDGVFLYGDEQSGEGFEVGNFKLDLRSSQIAGGIARTFPETGGGEAKRPDVPCRTGVQSAQARQGPLHWRKV
jgi:hypothetical protein